ncbi:hypothetical protein JTY60_01120 [symbiont of Argiope bruennichi]|uniref:hypothetical protein n=1 Tax=symbiont of Argiope bruennichi TaxID=2810479 RepID=UPI003DA4E758
MYQVIFDLSTKSINIIVVKEQKIYFSSFKKFKEPHSDVAIDYLFQFLKEKNINLEEVSEIIISQLSGSIVGNMIAFSLITCWKFFNSKTKFFFVDSLYLQICKKTQISAFNDVKKKYNFLLFNKKTQLFEKKTLNNQDFFELIKKYPKDAVQTDNQRENIADYFFINANKYKRPITDDYFCFRG